MLRGIGGEEDVGKELLESVARVLGPVLDVVADRGLQALHELGGRRAQLLDDLVPLIDVWLAVKVTFTISSTLNK